MDIYIVLDSTGRVVGASARLQGAELMRADEADRITDAESDYPRESMAWKADRRRAYDLITIANTELQDLE
jgi:hypothetical protein